MGTSYSGITVKVKINTKDKAATVSQATYNKTEKREVNKVKILTHNEKINKPYYFFNCNLFQYPDKTYYQDERVVRNSSLVDFGRIAYDLYIDK